MSTSEATLSSGEKTESIRLPTLEKYQVIDRLDKGGMGSVYLAQLHGDSEIYVVKLIHEDQLANEVVRSRFLREAQIAAELRHPKIARLTDAGRDQGRLYLAMEYIVGKDMESMMLALMRKRKMLPPGLTLTIGADVLEGLHYAHSLSDSEGNHFAIVHRDLSPRNVMITYDGQTKIIDFGLARTTLGEFRTMPGMVMGTLRYMSPEQAVAEPADRRSDIYTWGVVMYEALTGRPLVPDGEHRMILETVVNKIPAPLSTLNPALPKALDPVLAKALAKNREDRFDNAQEFYDALTKAAGDLCKTPREHIGQFVYGMFPGNKKKSEEVLRKVSLAEPTAMRESPEFEATRAGVPGMALADVPKAPVLVPESSPAVAQLHLSATTSPGSLHGSAQLQHSAHFVPAADSQSRTQWWVFAFATVAVATVLVGGLFWSQKNEPPPATVVIPPPPMPPPTTSPQVAPAIPRPEPRPLVESPPDAGLAPKRRHSNPKRRNGASKTPKGNVTTTHTNPPPPPPPPKSTVSKHSLAWFKARVKSYESDELALDFLHDKANKLQPTPRSEVKKCLVDAYERAVGGNIPFGRCLKMLADRYASR